MRGVKSILALTLVMAGASALARNGGYENHYTTTVAGYAGYGNEGIVLAMPTTAAAHTLTYAQCRALANCDLAHENVTSIGDAAFAYCGIASLTIPASVGELGYISFGGCSNLTEVSCDSWNWADGTANIEDKEPFRDCFKLKTIRVTGDAAEPPASFNVTKIFAALTTVYCPADNTASWESAYPSLEIIGVGSTSSPAPGLGSGVGLLNGPYYGALPANSQSEADAFVSTMGVQLTAADQAAGLDANNLRVFAALAPDGSDYLAFVAVDPEKVPAPVVGSSGSAAMTVSQNGDGVSVGIAIENAVQGLWYGCEVKESLSDPAFVNDVGSFVRATADGALVIPCPQRTSESAFYRVKVVASKPTE